MEHDFVLILSSEDFKACKTLKDPRVRAVLRKCKFTYDVYLADLDRNTYWTFVSDLDKRLPELSERIGKLGLQQEPGFVSRDYMLEHIKAWQFMRWV
jgi:hypothetical protein